MDKNHLIFLTAVLAMLAGASVVLMFASRPSPSPRLCAGMAQKIAEMDITLPGGKTAKFAKTGKGWEIIYPVAYKADERELSSGIKALCELKLSDTLSTSTETAASFGFTPENMVKVALYDGQKNKLAEFDAGKESPAAEAFFVRLPSGETKETSGLARGVLARPFTEWLDKTVYSAPMNKITAFEWRKAGETWGVSADASGKWKLEYKGKTTPLPDEQYQKKIAPLALMFADLRAERVLPAAGEYAQKNKFTEDFSVIITANGAATLLKVGTADSSGGRKVILKGEDRVVFMFPDWKALDMLAKPKDMLSTSK